MPQIKNLTQEQVAMLDEMWALETYEEYMEYLDSLNATDRKMAELLTKMVILAEMDEMAADCAEAKQVLKQFTLKK